MQTSQILTPTQQGAQQLYDRIRAQFAKGGRVVVQTTYRYTVYQPKHAALFSVSRAAEGLPGVWVARGKSREFVFAQYVRFELLQGVR